MFKQKQYIYIVVVVCMMLLSSVPVSASVIDDGNNSKQETNQRDERGYWWQFFYNCFPSYNNVQVDEKQEVTLEEEQNEQIEKEVERVEVEQPNEQHDESPLVAFESEVVELTNIERERYGLQPLQIDYKLSEVAREKSKDMRVNRYFDHNSPVYGSPFSMMQQFGVHYQTAGENIAMGQRSAGEVVQAWMNSAGHRANILNPNFTHIGVGFDENGYYWTQQFIGK